MSNVAENGPASPGHTWKSPLMKFEVEDCTSPISAYSLFDCCCYGDVILMNLEGFCLTE